MTGENKHPILTKNQTLVLETLTSANAPMSAYGILDGLRKEGLRAPLQVYRALEKLIELGLAHRLDSLNAFVACQSPDCDDEKGTVFMICQKCNQTCEAAQTDIGQMLSDLTKIHQFEMREATIELRGICQACKS